MTPYSPKNAMIVDADFLRCNPLFRGQHVIILGSGASNQAFPNGDRNGYRLPCMGDLLDVIDVGNRVLRFNSFENVSNFETLYSRLHKEGSQEELQVIEKEIYQYFSRMELPDSPTLYDHLLLSLRASDLVATFNWDPLLFDSRARLASKFGAEFLPEVVYLHGNVRIGYCPQHMRYGRNGELCDSCNNCLKPTPLLYPIEEKNYEADPSIKGAWQKLQGTLGKAFAVTIFGYGAPTSDRAAIDLMKKAWLGHDKRRYETLFFIDIKNRDQIITMWQPFIFSQHYNIESDFYSSWLPRHARRSIEALIVPTLEGRFVEDLPIPKYATWDELDRWFNNLIDAEIESGPVT